MNLRIGVGFADFGGESVGSFGFKIFDRDTDVGAVFDFELDVFLDDGVIGIAQNEKFGRGF